MKFDVVLESREELEALIKGLRYIPSLYDEEYHGDPPELNVGDALPYHLLEIAIANFDGVIGLRWKDPDLMAWFQEQTEKMMAKFKEFEETRELWKMAAQRDREKREQHNNTNSGS